MNQFAMIVDPFSSGALYAETLTQLGITPVAVLSRNPILDIYKSSFRKTDFKWLFTCQSNQDDLIQSLEEWLGNHKPMFVLPGTECGVELADRLAAHFCPDTANSSVFSHSRRDKFAMSQRLFATGLAAPKAIQSQSVMEVIHWARTHSLLPNGIVIKPLNSAGTDDVYACFTEAEIKNAMHASLGKKNQLALINEKILAQEYVSGTEYVVDTASYAGKHAVTSICRYKKINIQQANFIYDYVDFLPSHGAIQKELAHYIFSVLDSLGISYGPAHSEVMYTARGPRLIETGARLHGGVGILASRLATNQSQLEYALHLLLGKTKLAQHQLHFTLNKSTRIVFMITPAHGLALQDQCGYLEKIKSMPSTAFLKLNTQPGQALKKTENFSTIPGIVILNHASADQVEEDYQTLRAIEREGLFA